jgi:hypothetical protein
MATSRNGGARMKGTSTAAEWIQAERVFMLATC